MTIFGGDKFLGWDCFPAWLYQNHGIRRKRTFFIWSRNYKRTLGTKTEYNFWSLMEKVDIK